MKEIPDEWLDILMEAAMRSIKGAARYHIINVANPGLGVYEREYEVCDVCEQINKM